jgi:V-type H+-transporting ATPase subunit H
MAADAQSLLEKYQPDKETASTADVHQRILEMQKPSWGSYSSTKDHETVLSLFDPSAGGQANKVNWTKESAQACMAVMSIKEDVPPLQYILTVLYDMLREDSSSYTLFEDALKSGCDIFDPLAGLLKRNDPDAQWVFVVDRVAWLLGAIIAHMPRFFSEDQIKNFLVLLLTVKGTSCSELGILDAITNLVKCESHRALVWSQPGVSNIVFKVDPKCTPGPILYKSVFAIWMVSFDASLTQSLKDNDVIQKVKIILVHSRTEKVIRLTLTLLKNFLTQKSTCPAICEDIVEENILEAVKQLEYEKWRDTELYDDIRELANLISNEVNELSNFDRYMKELESGKLTWGFIHSSKFFGENVMKFETGEFKALKLLASLLSSSDPTTLAVACHDIGEFVSLHPLGKKQAGRLGVKERVMELMASPDQDKRDVRREALLCCQKIMLNKWQDVAAVEKK